MLAQIGDGGFALGARARQIRDDLLDTEKATEEDLLEIQLDDRALFLERWQAQLLEALEPLASSRGEAHAELRQLVSEWGGRAAVESVGYRMVRAYRLNVEKRLFDAITAECEAVDDRFDYDLLNQSEGPLWALVKDQPLHFLPPDLDSWQELFEKAIEDTLEYFSDAEIALRERTWGDRNTARIQHPLSGSVPFAAEWLNMPADALPGDSHMPRVQAPAHGASERFVVSPGHEEDGIFHMPGGQSGHPLSPFFRAGHEAWAKGEPTPFLPGATVHTLELLPTSR
jgi:penicillin amidase